MNDTAVYISPFSYRNCMTYFWSYKPALGGDHEGAPVSLCVYNLVESSWNVMAHGDARDGKWKGNWRMEWVASTLHTTSEHGVSSITTADAHTSAASSRLNWRPRRFKWTRPFRWKTKSYFCPCAITFQTQSTNNQTIFRRFHAIRSSSFYIMLSSNRFVKIRAVTAVLYLRP